MLSPGLVVAVVAIILIAVLFTWGVGIYNRFVSLRNRLQNAFAQIDVQLKRRYDLIPNLVEAVRGYMAHERQTLEAVTAARAAASGAMAKAAEDPQNQAAVRQAAAAENSLLASLSRLMIVREAYPDLKADRQVSQLMEELASTENRVAFARQAYNDSVMTYNTAVGQFPGNLVASVFSYQTAALFEIDNDVERQLTQVSFAPAAPPA